MAAQDRAGADVADGLRDLSTPDAAGPGRVLADPARPPGPLRPACWALWAAANAVDALADDRHASVHGRAVQIEAWITALDRDLAAGDSTDPVRRALVDTAWRWRLDLSGLRGALDVVRDDVCGRKFADWAAWRAWGRGNLLPWFELTRDLFDRAGAPVTLRLDRQEGYERFLDGFRLTDVLTDLAADLGQDDLPDAHPSRGHHGRQRTLGRPARPAPPRGPPRGHPSLTPYAFSTENWRREPEEVGHILCCLRDELDADPYRDLDVRLRWSGRPGRPGPLPAGLVDVLRRRESGTRARARLTLTMCINYGGRDENTQAAASLARTAQAGHIDPSLIHEADVAAHLPHPDLPDVDLLWRTSNEQRTSNFLLWQSTYAELYFTDSLRPDVDRRHLWQAITTYSRRQRRHGATPPA